MVTLYEAVTNLENVSFEVFSLSAFAIDGFEEEMLVICRVIDRLLGMIRQKLETHPQRIKMMDVALVIDLLEIGKMYLCNETRHFSNALIENIRCHMDMVDAFVVEAGR